MVVTEKKQNLDIINNMVLTPGSLTILFKSIANNQYQYQYQYFQEKVLAVPIPILD